MSRLIIKGKKINLDLNKKYIKEAIEDISLDSAGSMITDTVKSTLKISEGIIKNFIANTKFMISLSFLPLTKNLDNIIKNYEADIKNSNKLFTESIPSNVANSSKLIAMSANSPSIFFEKVSEEFEKIEGMKEIINAKVITDLSLIGPIGNLVNNVLMESKDIFSFLLNKTLNEIPQSIAGNLSNYSNTKENKKLEELRSKLHDGQKSTPDEGISGLIINFDESKTNNILIKQIVNPIRTKNSDDKFIKNLNEKNNDADILKCILSIIVLDNDIKKRNDYTWKKENAESPLNKNNIVRIKSSIFQNCYVTIKKSSENIITSKEELKNCFIAMDFQGKQFTNDYNLYDLFN